MKKLSKSNYLKGDQCEKALFLHLNHPELKDEISDAQQALFNTGHNIGNLSQQLFPGGIDASRQDFFNFNAAVKYIRPDKMLFVIVGDLEKIEPGIRELNLGDISYMDSDGNEVNK